MGGEGGCVGPLQALFGVRVGRDSLMRRGAPRVWLPPAKFRSEIWGVSHRHRPLRPAGGRGTARRVVVPCGWLRSAVAIALGSGAERSVCAAVAREWVGIAAEIIPKGAINAGQSLSQPTADSSLYTREPWGRGFGPPRSSAPTENPINHPSQPARSEASAPAAARDGRESTQGPSQKGGPPPRLPGQRLAKRKARG